MILFLMRTINCRNLSVRLISLASVANQLDELCVHESSILFSVVLSIRLCVSQGLFCK